MKPSGKIMTVNGPVDSSDLGFVLTHEHVLVDFIGAEQAGKHRYDEDEAFAVILPHLERAKELGCATFVECTPSYLGKDPLLLKRLSAATGIHLLTNTGYYGAAADHYVPAHAYSETADQLARRWIEEWEGGIDGTGVRPGFIKIGVDPQPLSEIDEKLVRAAARTHHQTGLTIMSHTSLATPAREEIAVLKEEGVSPAAWIWTHAQNETDNDQHRRAAEQGAWIAFDGANADPEQLARDLKHLLAMKEYGLLNHVLLSHDAGWYRPGEAMGGVFRPFVDLFEVLLPAMREHGFTAEELDLLTVENPRRAFSIEVRAP
ncbi:MAG: phosphotriesterase-related protein [Candidatus Latescibacterota bacterium]|jgi:phosphotriesterase-related protein